MFKRYASRSFLPIVGIVFVAVLVLQSRSLRGERPPAPVAAVASATPHRVVAEGNVQTYPGLEAEVGSEIGGVIDTVLVEEGTAVKKGQLLARLRGDDLRAALAEAHAALAEADANVRLGEIEVQRARDLWEKEVGSRQLLDEKQRDVEAARARRATARATARRLEAVVKKTEIRSPIDGIVVTRHVDPGESIDEGADVVAVADVSRLRVQAEVDEYDVARVNEGDAVVVTAEGFPGQSWRGRVEDVPSNVVPRALRSQDPSRPTDTSVLLVKIALEEQTPLRLGQRVDIEVVPGR